MASTLGVFLALRGIEGTFEECCVVYEVPQDRKLPKNERYAGRTRIHVFT